MIKEECLQYISSTVLGLNDALVELTGALAGLTFALRDGHLIATAGLLTGIAASLSMAASEYLATRSEDGAKDPVKAALFTGSAYIITVLCLVFPYIIFSNAYVCLGFALLNAIVVISLFTYAMSVIQGISFKRSFLEMVGISMGVAALTFVIGIIIQT